MLRGLGSRYPRLRTSIVRLGAVNGAGAGAVDVSAISKFVKAAAAGEQIAIEGGHQTTDVVDVRDVADALSLLIACPPDERMDMYVVSSPCAYSISEIAAKCVELSKNPQVKPVLLPSRNQPSYAMDPSRFMSQFHWKPRYSLDDIIISLSRAF
jgi:nucleoside-diphosphate-sugar epimerase